MRRYLRFASGVVFGCGIAASPGVAQHEHHDGALAEPSVELEGQLARVREATARFQDHAVARAEGYRLFGRDGALTGEHWYHPDIVHEPFDPARPSTLQYVLIDGRRVLVGVAYTVYQRPGEAVPEGFAGTADHWHVHDVEALARALTSDRPLLSWIVDRRADRGKLGAGEGRTQLSMVHAWVWSENPDGVFAGEHTGLPYLRAGLPIEPVTPDAALGIALLDEQGCEVASAEDDLLRPTRQQRRELERACVDAATAIAAALTAEPGSFAAAAARTWQEYQTARRSILTADQLARAEAIRLASQHPIMN